MVQRSARLVNGAGICPKSPRHHQAQSRLHSNPLAAQRENFAFGTNHAQAECNVQRCMLQHWLLTAMCTHLITTHTIQHTCKGHHDAMAKETNGCYRTLLFNSREQPSKSSSLSCPASRHLASYALPSSMHICKTHWRLAHGGCACLVLARQLDFCISLSSMQSNAS